LGLVADGAEPVLCVLVVEVLAGRFGDGDHLRV